ncbi:MAG: DUF6062 family protein, partial [Lachnospiraceae bacterium]|nr:DUF6062 family protein [Lachnospiraceae bacterium]
MDEQLYTIPVNDAFDSNCECPLCVMRRALEVDAIEFTMGPSYMDDDVRMQTNKTGFCAEHVRMLYANGNRLGLGLMLHTHMQQVIKDVTSLQEKPVTGKSLFSKGRNPLIGYFEDLEKSCFICDRINRMFSRYVDTIFYLYRKDKAFRDKFAAGKGFCNSHYALLRGRSESALSGKDREEFVRVLDKLYLENMKRVCDDVEWFTDKFDYRNVDAPWKNSKDALVRGILKL